MTPLEAIRAVMASRLDASPAHVLMCWASHVDADGKAWPGAKRLSELSRLSERTVRASMGVVRKAGILSAVGTHASGTLIERLDLDALAAWSPPAVAAPPLQSLHPPATVAPPADSAPTPCNPCTHPLQRLQDPPADSAPKGVIEEDREEVKEEDTRRRPPADPPPAIREPVLVSPVERPPVADDWTQLRDHFDTFPWTRAPRDRKKGAGIQLVKLLDACDGDLQTAKTVLDWWAWADTPRARQLRTGDSRGSESDAAPVYGLTTLTTDKNAHEYITQALSWAKQRNPPRRKLSADASAIRSLSIPEQRARDVISDEPTPIQRKLAEQAAKRAKEKP